MGGLSGSPLGERGFQGEEGWGESVKGGQKRLKEGSHLSRRGVVLKMRQAKCPWFKTYLITGFRESKRKGQKRNRGERAGHAAAEAALHVYPNPGRETIFSLRNRESWKKKGENNKGEGEEGGNPSSVSGDVQSRSSRWRSASNTSEERGKQEKSGIKRGVMYG